MFYGLRELGYLKVKSLAKSHIERKTSVWNTLKIGPRVFAVGGLSSVVDLTEAD